MSRVRIRSLLVLTPRRRFTLDRFYRILVALHVIRVTALRVMAPLGGRKTLKERFSHLQLDEVQVGNNSLQVYRDGHDLFDAMLAAVDGAQDSIYLESSIWRDDEVGRAFKRHLAQKATQGVAVYVMCAGFSNRMIPRACMSFPSGVHIPKHTPFRRPWHVLDPRRYAPDHRKLLVVDGLIGFVGGYNLGKRYASGWRDTHLRLRGPAATDLAHAFIAYWDRFSPLHEQITHRYLHQFNPWIVVRANDALRLTFPIRDMYIEAIDRAEQTILLTNASFVPDHSLLEALKAAVARGVDVRVLVPWPSNHSISNQPIGISFTECLQAGMRLFGYRHAILRAKTCTIDGQWSTIGSAHLDFLSSVVNYELNIEIYDAAFASQMQDLFARDTADAIELSLAEWMNRPWYRKLSEHVLAPLRFLL